jgi:hypothetical protein
LCPVWRNPHQCAVLTARRTADATTDTSTTQRPVPSLCNLWPAGPHGNNGAGTARRRGARSTHVHRAVARRTPGPPALPDQGVPAPPLPHTTAAHGGAMRDQMISLIKNQTPAARCAAACPAGGTRGSSPEGALDSLILHRVHRLCLHRRELRPARCHPQRVKRATGQSAGP